MDFHCRGLIIFYLIICSCYFSWGFHVFTCQKQKVQVQVNKTYQNSLNVNKHRTKKAQKPLVHQKKVVLCLWVKLVDY